MSVLILCFALFGGLLLIPLGLPGTWAMVAAALVYELVVPGSGIGPLTVGGTAALALIAELFEFFLAARFTHRYGGSRRAGWGAVTGGLVGVFVGVPVPIVGPVIGGLLGCFLGALIGEYERAGDHRAATRAAFGAFLGRIAGATLKVATGVAIAVWIVAAATTLK